MATPDVTPTRRFDLKLTLLASAGLETSSVSYDRFADTLVFAFTRDHVPSVGVALSDFLLLRVDPTTEEVVGVDVEHFVKAAVYEHPELFGAVQWVDIPPRDVNRMRKRLEIPKDVAPEANADAMRRGLMDVIRAQFGINESPSGAFGVAHS